MIFRKKPNVLLVQRKPAAFKASLASVVVLSLLVAACGGGGGGGTPSSLPSPASPASSGSISITATATTTAQSLTVGTAMTSLSPLTPSGGATPYTYSIKSGTLPAGLSLDASTGTVTGTPTATYTAANVVFSVKDANNVVASATSSVSFTVGSTGSATPSSGWANVKFGGGGYVPGLIFHPTVPNVLYARTDVAGAYRWDNANSKWIPITDMFNFTEGRFQGVESIALDPTDANKVYLVGGMYVNSGNARLYTSSDKGATWTYVDLPFPAGGNNAGRAIGERLMVDPNKPSVLFYASRSQGLWKSADSGTTWNQVTGLSAYKMTPADIGSVGNSPIGIEGVVFDTAVPTSGFISSGTATKTLYVSVAPDYMAMAGLSSYLYKSIDGGATWTGVPIPPLVTTFTNAWQTTPIKPYIPHMVRDTDTTASRKFYVVFAGGTGPGAGGPAWLYSFNGGTGWSSPLKSTAPGQWTSPGFGGVSVYGTGASTRIALGETNSWGGYAGMTVVALSKDAGATWTEIADNRTSSGWIDDVEINPFNPENVLHVHGGGVWSTSNASNAIPSWTPIVDGIEELATRSLMTPPPGASYLFVAGYWDVGTQVHTNVNTKPTTNIPGNISFGNGNGADMAWTNPAYIAAIGSTNGNSGNTSTVGVYSTDSGVNWTAFAAQPPFAPSGANVDQGGSGEANIAVTAQGKLVWAPTTANGNVTSSGVPYYTTDNGVTWTATNLPPPTKTTVNSAYHLAADRQNPNKVYAYDSGGADWTGARGQFYYSTDGGKIFTKSTDATLGRLRWHQFTTTWLAVNPNAEGDVWLADGDNLYRSTDSGVSWTKLSNMASTPAGYNPYGSPTLFGAQRVALGKPVAGSSYSAAVYLVGTFGGVAGLYRSDNAGSTWTRINDDAHQWGGIGALAADNTVAGRVYLAGRGVLYNY
jgi:xyloglucan-specific exo-beta-1,4-glucanase